MTKPSSYSLLPAPGSPFKSKHIHIENCWELFSNSQYGEI